MVLNEVLHLKEKNFFSKNLYSINLFRFFYASEINQISTKIDLIFRYVSNKTLLSDKTSSFKFLLYRNLIKKLYSRKTSTSGLPRAGVTRGGYFITNNRIK